MLKSFVRAAASVPFRALPSPVRRRLMQLLTDAAAARGSRDALRELLVMEGDLAGQIDLAAIRHDNGVHAKHRLMKYHDFFVERIKSGERVLDIGCGYGAVAHSIASRAGALVTGLDVSRDNLAIARRLFSHPQLTFVEGTAPGDLPAGPFDVIVISNVLEHIDDRRGFVAEVQKRVAPTRWLIRVPMIDRHWHVPLRQELGLFFFSDPTHFVEYTRESFEREMVAMGLTLTHLQINWGEIWAEVHA